MHEKFMEQFKKTKAGIILLSQNVDNCVDYQELINTLNVFYDYVFKIANKKNNRPNKNLMAVINYLDNECGKKRELETVVKKAKIKKLKYKKSYKDYIEDYIILRKRGYSYKEISEYSKNHFKIKVSKSTIGKILKDLGDKENAK